MLFSFHAHYPLSELSFHIHATIQILTVNTRRLKGGDVVVLFSKFGSHQTHFNFGALAIKPSSNSVRSVLHGTALTFNTSIDESMIAVESIRTQFARIPLSYLLLGTEHTTKTLASLIIFTIRIQNSLNVTGSQLFKSVIRQKLRWYGRQRLECVGVWGIQRCWVAPRCRNSQKYIKRRSSQGRGDLDGRR